MNPDAIHWLTFPGSIAVATFLGYWLCAARARPRIQALRRSLETSRRDTVEHNRVLNNASLRSKGVQREVEGLRKTIRVLPEIAQELIGTHETRKIPGIALDLIEELFGPSYSAFFQIAKDELVAVAVRGLTDIRLGHRVSNGKGIVGWTALKQLPLTPEDVELETALVRAQHLDCGPSDNFQICLPILDGERTMAVILIGPSEHALPHAKEVARTIALITSVSIMSAKNLRAQTILAQRDGLTGLFNKRHILSKLERLLGGRDDASDVVSLFLFDIDHFKNYNDTNGHVAGDDLLRELGELLGEHVRDGEFAGRYGGEEFLIILPGASREEGLKAADRIRARIAETPFRFRENQPNGRISVSGGVATYPTDSLESEMLIKMADKALYEAKRAGRDRVFLCSGEELNLDDPLPGEDLNFCLDDADAKDR
jgi:diguanylate cyclase (GGDEF)-like protein